MMNPSRELLQNAADAEDKCESTSVGGLALDVGLLTPHENPSDTLSYYVEEVKRLEAILAKARVALGK